MLEGQVAVVTGGARGIGQAIAARLTRDGCRVIVWDRDVAPLAGQRGALVAAATRQVDVTDAAAVVEETRHALDTFGRLDILINNAGVNGPVLPVWDYPLDAWDRVLAVDLTGVFHCCRAVVPHMRAAGRGRIVNVASIAGKEGMPGISAYAAAKAGVIAFTKSIARELVDSGVLVNAIAPVITETELFREMTEEHIASAKARIPLGRFLTVEEIAAMVAWMVGPECTFTTGFTFDVSGGRATY